MALNLKSLDEAVRLVENSKDKREQFYLGSLKKSVTPLSRRRGAMTQTAEQVPCTFQSPSLCTVFLSPELSSFLLEFSFKIRRG